MAKFASVRALLLTLLFPAVASSATLDDYYLSKFGQQAQLAKALESVLGVQSHTAERCRTDLYRSLKRDFKSLEPATQKALAKYLERPVLANANSYNTDHFSIFYATSGGDAPALIDVNPSNGVPDWVETVGAVFENVYAKEVTIMGYRPPPVAPRYEVYLLDLTTQRAYGFTTDFGAPTVPNVSVGSYIEIDRAFTDSMFTGGIYSADQMLQITAAHEFHHAIQFGYNYYFDIWYGEATSTWMEDQVYDDVNQCYSYLVDYVPIASTISLNAPLGGLSEYGRWIFNRYLAEQHDALNNSVVRSIWEKLGTLSPSSSPKTSTGDLQMPPVIDSVLVNTYGSSLAADFLGFAKRVYARNWSSHLADLNRIPTASISGSYSSYPVPSQVVTVPHYTFAYYRLVPSAGVVDLTITVTKTSGAQVSVLKKSSGVVSEIAANVGGASYTVTGFGSLNPATDEVVLVVANTTNLDGHQVSFSTNGSTSTVTDPTVSTGGGGGGGGGCFIATAAYGSYLHPKVAELRAFRDHYLLTNAPGRLFVAAYYRLSPPIADVIARHEWMKSGVRGLLLPLIFAAEHPAAALAMLLLVVGASLRWGVLYLKGRARQAVAA